MISSNFFDNALEILKIQPRKSNQLLDCLEFSAKRLGMIINWDFIKNPDVFNIATAASYGRSIGLALHATTIQNLEDIANLLFPVIVQLDNSDEFRVVTSKSFGRKAIITINSGKAYTEPFTPEMMKRITGSWECCPINFPVSTNFYDLFRSIFKSYKKDITISILLGLVVSISTLIISMFFGYIFGNAYDIEQNTYAIIYLSFIFFILSASIFNYMSDLYFKSLNVKVMIYTLPSIWNHIISLPIASSKKYLSADLTQRILDYESSLSLVITTMLTTLGGIISILLLIGFMSYLNPLLAFIYFCIYFIFMIIKMLILPINVEYINSYLADQGRITSLLNEVLLQIHKIRSANVEYITHRKWLYNLIGAKIYLYQSIKLETIIWIIESMVPLSILLFFYMFIYLYPNAIDTYNLLQFMICAGQLSIFFDKLSMDIITLVHVFPGLTRLFPVLREEVEKRCLSNNIAFRGEIKLANVSLLNPETGSFILENISMNIKPGSFVAIIGHSGSGKSTIFKLLLGFESKYSGEIQIDNENIKHLDMSLIRKNFGVVLQSTSIFPGTIFSNIATNTNITLDEAWRLAKCVGLDEEINLMPMKMYTHISDNAGESISGGQKQKILIARALGNNPKVLFLDEATSALDNKSQSLIFNNLKSLNITRFVIAHRYSTIIDADVIYLLDEGRVVDSGSYRELVQRGQIIT